MNMEYVNALLFLLLHVVCPGGTTESSKVTMRSTHNVHHLSPGETATLPCDFSMAHYDIFYNPVVFVKQQLTERVNINILGNAMAPFDKGRHRLTMEQPSDQDTKVVLTITGVRLEDYGNYTCEVRGRHSTVLANVTHYVFIKTPVHSIRVTDSQKNIDQHDEDRVLHLREGRSTTLYCKALGGCPPPEMQVYLGSRDVTRDLNWEMYTRLAGIRGLRRLEHVTEAWMELVVAPNMDKRYLECLVTIPGLGSNISAVKLRVSYAPVIVCNQTHASLGEETATLVCTVRSRPAADFLHWFIFINGTRVSQEPYLNRDLGEGMFETRLTIRHVTEESYRTYTVEAKNDVGVTTYDVDVKPSNMYEKSDKRIGGYPDRAVPMSGGCTHTHFFWILVLSCSGLINNLDL